ncbi:hypothetical protein PRO82_001000 [Candidatus Protochlamydia amoebophila]|nr:hypothetical protein [Candidatus Protochlamydia amoebophila]
MVISLLPEDLQMLMIYMERCFLLENNFGYLLQKKFPL